MFQHLKMAASGGLLVVLSCSSGGPAHAQNVSPPRDELIVRADKLRLEGKNEESLKLWNQILWLDSDCGQCFGFRSGVLGNLGRFKEGVGDAHVGVQRAKKPRDKALAAYNLGFNLTGLGRTSEALDAYEDCIRFDSTFPMCYFGKGKTLVDLERYAEALKALETATQLNPTHGPSWAMRAGAEGGVGLWWSSLSSGMQAVEFAPKDPRSYLARGYGFGLNSMYEEMLADATKALELDPNRPRAHLMRGQALRLLGREEDAAREFDLEVDRTAVAHALHPETNIDLRIYNCGDPSTDIQTPDRFNVDGVEECRERALKALIETATPPRPKPTPKYPIPGLPQPKAKNN